MVQIQIERVIYIPGDDPRAAVLSAIAGHPVEVSSQVAVWNLCHALDRLPERRTHKMILRRLVGDGRLIWIVPKAFVTGCN